MQAQVNNRMCRWMAMLVVGLASCSDEQSAPRDRRVSGDPGEGGGAASFGGGAANSVGRGGAGSPSVVQIGDGCAAISQTAVNRLQPADIVFAIDNSGSMDEEIVFVREQMNAFSQQIVDSGIDVRIIVISAPLGGDADADAEESGGGDPDDQDNGICIAPPLGSGNCPEDSSSPRYLHVPAEVGSNDSLNLIVDTYPDWRSQLRPNATKSVIVVTDDDATDGPSNSAEAFRQALTALDPALFADFTFSGIYCFSECPEAAEIGLVYMDLVAQTQGVSGDLCLQDFAPVFDALAQAVIGASTVDCQWDVPPAPAGAMFEIGKVNVQYTPSNGGATQTVYHVASASDCGAQQGWFYDDNASPTQLLACPSTCDVLSGDPNAQLDVLFGCETSEGPD